MEIVNYVCSMEKADFKLKRHQITPMIDCGIKFNKTRFAISVERCNSGWPLEGE
jgi:hypothetical protein